jgi:hypothetical protein
LTSDSGGLCRVCFQLAVPGSDSYETLPPIYYSSILGSRRFNDRFNDSTIQPGQAQRLTRGCASDKTSP